VSDVTTAEATDAEPRGPKPPVPSGLVTTSVTADEVDLFWTASGGATIGYHVYRDGVAVGTSDTTIYADSTVEPSSTYNYTLDAYDAVGGTSARSAPLLVVTPADPDSEPPPPTWLVRDAPPSEDLDMFLADGWEPFGVSDRRVYVRKQF
jgi:chitodextrinase